MYLHKKSYSVLYISRFLIFVSFICKNKIILFHNLSVKRLDKNFGMCHDTDLMILDES